MRAAPDAIDELRFTAQPLPRSCAPLPRETTNSYIRRLASANLMDPEELRILVTGDVRRSARPRPAVLSRLSGYAEHTLVHALPELSPPGLATALGDRPYWEKGPGCLLCNAARGAVDTASVWHSPDDVICLRHRRWTSRTDRAARQPDLSNQPEILAAHRAYRRLTRAHRHDRARAALREAAWVLGEWQDTGSYDYTETEGFDRRMRYFLGPNWSVHLGSPFAAAAQYPQLIALTRLLASPYWMDLAQRDHIAAGRPDTARRGSLADAVREYRRASDEPVPDPYMPGNLAAELACTYLRTDGPSLRIFLDEVRRTVERRYKWFPYPKKFLADDLHGAGPVDPLAALINDRVRAERARLANKIEGSACGPGSIGCGNGGMPA